MVGSPYDVASGKSRARRSSTPARPYICRRRVFSRLMCPSTGPLLQRSATAPSGNRTDDGFENRAGIDELPDGIGRDAGHRSTPVPGVVGFNAHGRTIMKALCWHATGDVRVDTVPDPTIQEPRDVVIKITTTAICGSDLHLLNGFQPTMEKGDVLGHENMSEVDHERRVLVIVSDGEDNVSRATFEDVMAQTQASNALIYTVALVDPMARGTHPKQLTRIAVASGGEAFAPEDVGEISDVLRRIAADIRHTYTLGYVSTNAARDGTFRTVRVTVQPPGDRRGLIIRTRRGYQAPGAPPHGGHDGH